MGIFDIEVLTEQNNSLLVQEEIDVNTSFTYNIISLMSENEAKFAEIQKALCEDIIKYNDISILESVSKKSCKMLKEFLDSCINTLSSSIPKVNKFYLKQIEGINKNIKKKNFKDIQDIVNKFEATDEFKYLGYIFTLTNNSSITIAHKEVLSVLQSLLKASTAEELNAIKECSLLKDPEASLNNYRCKILNTVGTEAGISKGVFLTLLYKYFRNGETDAKPIVVSKSLLDEMVKEIETGETIKIIKDQIKELEDANKVLQGFISKLDTSKLPEDIKQSVLEILMLLIHIIKDFNNICYLYISTRLTAVKDMYIQNIALFELVMNKKSSKE